MKLVRFLSEIFGIHRRFACCFFGIFIGRFTVRKKIGAIFSFDEIHLSFGSSFCVFVGNDYFESRSGSV